jgi:NADH-quinone oxidoreductase subunit J
MTQLFWWVFASLAVGGGLGTVLSRNPMASLLFLVLSFFSLASIHVLLGAHFIAAIQVIVYAGAIMVLFLFVIMLLNLGHDYRADLRSIGWKIVAFAMAGLVGYGVYDAFTSTPSTLMRVAEPPPPEANAVGAIAYPMFEKYIVPFEMVGVLLLVAIVGAVLVAKRRV